MADGLSTTAVVAAAIGGLVIWAGIKGVSVTGGLRSLISGSQPSSANANPLSDPSSSSASGSGSGASGSSIADKGLSYVGSGSVYKWGGGSPSGWDCSGFVNYVVGHDLSMAIPGSSSGNYSGHGPVTAQWAVFGKSISRNQVQAGDLVVWPLFHMGIAISNTQMVNCPGPNGSANPIVSSIDENIGGPVVYRRI